MGNMARTAQLNPRQQRFVAEYLIDLNATQAAIRAGYSSKTAEVQGPRLLGNVRVSSAIADATDARARRTQITQDRVLQELGRIAFFDIRRLYNEDGTLKSPHELDDDAAAVLSAIEVTETLAGEGPLATTKKAKVFDKSSALTLAMRHLGMLKDRIEHSGPNGGPIATVGLTTDDPVEAARQYQRIMAGDG